MQYINTDPANQNVTQRSFLLKLFNHFTVHLWAFGIHPSDASDINTGHDTSDSSERSFWLQMELFFSCESVWSSLYSHCWCWTKTSPQNVPDSSTCSPFVFGCTELQSH